ncbi:helix-turn-helix domain-containing protein [Vaginella massiliensis]|uniref:helix-turn-helix domain-containing protein n=1 Tax=Vaginella massiliensis TaxID=1816680 RepID=UPI000B9B421C|nr:helix-turn-helix domain-containing protein [Vaginella massiliensis]
MSKANFTILKQCEHCAEMFEAQKRTTRFCSHKCASRNYKLRKRQELKKEVEQETKQKLKPKIKAFDLATIKEKEFLTVAEVAKLFGCSKQTIYRMIETNEIHALNLNKKLTRIRRKDIEQLFEQTKKKAPKVLTPEQCYQMGEIIEKYKVSRNTIYNYGNKHNIQRLKLNGITYYSKTDIDNLFSP